MQVLLIVEIYEWFSHGPIFLSSYLPIFSSSYLLIFTYLPIFSSSFHILTSSHLCMFTSSHLLIFTFSLALLLSCPLAPSFFSISLLKARGTTLHPIVVVRWPLQPLQPLQKTQLQPPVGPSVDSLCHPWFTSTNLSYRFPIFESSATALCGTTGIFKLFAFLYVFLLFFII